jgi:DNA methylase
MRHRFHALCSYFAMFPESFAEKWIDCLTKPNDVILDPFCGRGTLPFQALLMNRNSIGCDTNPVAYCISRAKTNAPPVGWVLRRLNEIEDSYDPGTVLDEVAALPPFFHHAYHPETLSQIIHLRGSVTYRSTATDCMIAALVLGSLHGETDRSTRFLSNQMPHTISTKPDYSIRFWKQHRLTAPRRETFKLLREQAVFRYESGRPKGKSLIFHIDMRDLPQKTRNFDRPIRCVVTSPPYFDVTNYSEDQWLRLWFLGEQPHPVRGPSSRDDRHSSIDRYWSLLADMWRSLGCILERNSNVIVRVGARRISPDRLVSGLEGVARASGRQVRLIGHEVSTIVRRQTDSFRPGSTGCKVEVDCHFRMA